MDTSKMSHEDRQHRMNVRNGFMTATVAELENAIDLANFSLSSAPMKLRIECLEELKAELIAEQNEPPRKRSNVWD